MRELVKMEQDVTIVPKDFNFTNKGVVTEVSEKGFKMKMKFPTTGIKVNHICEFYSQTPNGTLFFESYTKEMNDNTLFIMNPIKHRFLQRRQFTRIKFITDTKMSCDNEDFNISTLDLSAGGLKFQSEKNINIEKEYRVILPLSEEQVVTCILHPIRIEKQDTNKYLLSGRFINTNNVDKMTLIQYCMQKNMESKSK